MAPEPLAAVNSQWWPAPAKLNLFLHVTGRRPDGLHNLQTLFQILDWGDSVFIKATNDGAITRRAADYAVEAEQDLVIRAARLLREATGFKGGAELEVRKHIPTGSGLGGGSSNAATVLCVLNWLWDCGLGADALADLGLQLGADVPVFVRGHSAVATGVGEALEPVVLGERYYLLVTPRIHISTAQIFSDPELRRDSAEINLAAAQAGGGRNDCQPVACARFPELAALFGLLAPFGEPRLSGTGSSIFISMPSQAAAQDAANLLQEQQKNGSAQTSNCRYNVRAVGGLDRSPLHRELEKVAPGLPPSGSNFTVGT